MKNKLLQPLLLLILVVSAIGVQAAPKDNGEPHDPYLWLENIDSARSLDWVKQQNSISEKRLTALPGYSALYNDALKILTSTSRIPKVEQHGDYLYNLWQDPAHPRGLYRRTSMAEFRKSEPQWEIVLDVDALSKTEGKLWAFGGADFLAPGNQRCLIALSPGGGDATEIREFDLIKKEFVAQGFQLPVAKSRVSWRNADSLYVATNFGPGSLNTSGSPRQVKIWNRATPLDDAMLLFEGKANSVGTGVQTIKMKGYPQMDILTDALTFWNSNKSLIIDGKIAPLNLPATAHIAGGYQGQLVIWLKEKWTTRGQIYPAGSVLLANPSALMDNSGTLELVAAPDKHAIILGVESTSAGLLLSTLDDVRGQLHRYTRGTQGWNDLKIPLPDNGSLNIATVNDDNGDAIVQFESFLTPPALYHVPADGGPLSLLKQQDPSFDGSRFEVTQHWVTSADGTSVPYFVVAQKNLQQDGKNPVWMFAYGGFEVALKPTYSGSYEDLQGAYGKLWLERGGVFVLANIRGGGEFGPEWHTTALKENHVKAFEDFEAIAADLAKNNISSPAHIGIEGRSNGGLLVSSTMLRHPELYGAVVCGNPLIDMRRYSKLLAGASWIGEYGDPDIADQWAYLRTYSPYQKVVAGMHLPPVMFYSTTRDDRVHPAHARKMAAKMKALHYQVEYFENVEGGHHGPVVTEQLATRIARTYAFLWQHLR